METYLRDEEGNFIHPNAVRYFLYQALELMKQEKVFVDKENKKKEKFFDDFYNIFDDPKTDETETVDQLTERKIDKKTQQEMKDQFRYYLSEVDKYRTSSVLAEVLREGIDYITNLCDAFQTFYASFEDRIGKLDRRINSLLKKYVNTAGKTTRYVCASANCFNRLLKEMPYTGNTITIDKELAEDIYSKVRGYSMMKDKPENGGYFEELFEDGIIGYFEKSLMEIYGTTVNMDVLSALEREAKYEASLLMKHIGKLKTDEFKKSGLTIFDLALLLKVSTPAAEFDKKVGKDIMRESLQMIYEYMSTIVLGDDLDWIYGNFVFDQVKAFDKNVDWYFANWRDDFSDYVDDLMQIAANELENKEQENLCEKMQELIENARERRE